MWKEPKINWRKLFNPSGLPRYDSQGTQDAPTKAQRNAHRRLLQDPVRIMKRPEWKGSSLIQCKTHYEIRHPSGATLKVNLPVRLEK